MLVDRYAREDVFAQVPKLAQEIDPVLRKLDGLLEDDNLYQQVRTDFGQRARATLVHGRHSTPVEVLLRLLILKHLYQWSYKETEGRVADSLVLRWFCRLGMQPAPPANSVSRGAGQVSVATLEALANRVKQAKERAKASEGRLRPTYRERWR